MHIISYKAIREFAAKRPQAKKPLDHWYGIAKRAQWQTIDDVKTVFPHADAVDGCTVFNIGGNKYRLISKIRYKNQIIYIRFILTHADYDKGEWKSGC